MSKFDPAYPEPQELKTSSRVVFSALKTDIATLSDHFFGEQRVKAGLVGERAFHSVLNKVRKK